MRRDLKKYQNYGEVMEETIRIVSEDKSLTRVMRKGYLSEIGIPRLTTEELLNETYFYLMSQEAGTVADGFDAAARERDRSPVRSRAAGRLETGAQQFMEEFGSRKWCELMDFLFERPHYIDFQRSYRGSVFYTPEIRQEFYNRLQNSVLPVRLPFSPWALSMIAHVHTENANQILSGSFKDTPENRMAGYRLIVGGLSAVEK